MRKKCPKAVKGLRAIWSLTSSTIEGLFPASLLCLESLLELQLDNAPCSEVKSFCPPTLDPLDLGLLLRLVA